MAQVFDAVTTTSLSVDGVDVTAHKLRHELGGADAINVTGLSGALADAQKITVQDEGSTVNSRAIINFAGAGVTVTDDGGNSRVNVTIPGGGSGITVQENGSTVEAAATTLNFQNGVVATSGGANIANLNVDYGTGTQPLGTAAAGTANSVSRSDHVHAHGAQAGGTLHALATPDPGGTAGFMSAADKAKLDKLNANGGYVSQAAFAEQTVLFSTSSTTYVAFLTASFTTSATASFLQVAFSAGHQSSNSNSVNYFALYLNGTFIRSCGVRVSSSGAPQPAALVYRISATPSTLTTVEIRTRTSNGTMTIDPYNGTTGTDGHHASMTVLEISS